MNKFGTVNEELSSHMIAHACEKLCWLSSHLVSSKLYYSNDALYNALPCIGVIDDVNTRQEDRLWQIRPAEMSMQTYSQK